MAGNIGDLLFKLMGQEDPRSKLLSVAAGGDGTQATPQPAVATPDAAGGGAGAVAPPPTQATAYQSPAELVGLYEKVMERDRANASIDSGAALLAASFAQDENRPGLMRLAGGGGTAGSGTAAAGMVDQIMQMNKATADMAKKAAMRARLPDIAKRYNLDIDTATLLFESGELDKLITEAEKPNNQVVKNEDGTNSIVDVNGNTVLSTFGPKKPDEIEYVDDGNGGKAAVWKTGPHKGKPVGGGTGVPGTGGTPDIKELNAVNADRAARNLPPIPPEEWLKQKTASGAGKATDAQGNILGDPPKDYAWKLDANGKVERDSVTGSPIAVPVANGPEDTRTKDANKEAAKGISHGVVMSKIDQALGQADEEFLGIPITTGFMNQISGAIGGTPAYDLNETMSTIKANIGFDKLQEMRNNSPTGGALGQVSDFENKLLQDIYTSLSAAQSGPQFKRSLRELRTTLNTIMTSGLKPGPDGKPIPKFTPEEIERKKAELGEKKPDAPASVSDDDLINKWKTKK